MKIRFLCAISMLLLVAACGEKKSEPSASPDTVEADSLSITPSDTIEEAYAAAEIFEYRSEALKNYELYAIYPFEDAAQFVVVRNGEARLLALNEERELEEGQALDDEEFNAVKFLQQAEGNGIITFEQLELTNKAEANFSFNHSFTKRALTIGSAYNYTAGNGSGGLTLSQTGENYTFAVNTNSGEYMCELEGSVLVKGNIGYFQGQPYDATCKLIFFFTDKKVQLLQISSNPDCGCGANASLNATFTSQ